MRPGPRVSAGGKRRRWPYYAGVLIVLAIIATATSSGGRAAVRGSAAQPLSLITEPNQGITPIVQQVSAARRSVDVVMYELSDPAFEAALIADHRRGVKIRVLLNGGYYGGGGFAQNDAARADLEAHGVTVRSSPSYFALTHQKTIVIDDRVADIMTLNLTSQYYSTSRDFDVIDSQPGDVDAIEATFDADWSGHRIGSQVGTGDLVWSPGAAGSEIALIDSARHSLDIYNEEMDDPEITGALVAAARRGVDVKVVMTADAEWDSAFSQLAGAGVHVRTYTADASLYIHAKMILVDARMAFLGSQNFSPTSLNDNRELGITLSDSSILRSLQSTFTSDYAGAHVFATSSSTPVHGGGTGSSPRPSCRVSATYDSEYNDWDVDVSGAPANTTVTATADGYTHSYHSDSSGDVDIYLDAPESDAGATVRVSAGSVSCVGRL